MKLQTMLLPTGHWLAVVTGDPLPEKHVEVLKELFKKSGALEVLHAPAGNIEIVNAVVASEAIFYSHAEPEVEIEVEDEEPVDADPVFVRASPLGTFLDRIYDEINQFPKPAPSQHFTDTLTFDDMTRSAWEKVQDGAEVSPAGLLKLTDEQKAEHAGLTKADLESGTAELDDNAAAQVQQHHFPPTGRRSTDGCPCYPDGRMTVDAPCDNCPLDRGFGDLAVGDRVRVTGHESLWDSTGIQGYEGVVCRLQDRSPLTGGPVVWVGQELDDYTYAVRPGDLERI